MTIRLSLLLLLAICGITALVHSGSAGATFPGFNGKIAFTSSKTDHAEIYTIDPNGTNETRITFDNEFDFWPKWSPNGDRLAFMQHAGNDAEIVVTNRPGRRMAKESCSSVNRVPYQLPVVLRSMQWMPMANTELN